MPLSGTPPRILSLVFIIVELMLFGYQFVYYLYRPDDRKRFYFLVLIKLVWLYNVMNWLFPDPRLTGIPIMVQEILAYGSGLLAAAYFPFYFYKALELNALRWHVRYVVPILLILPYVISFTIDYAVRGYLDSGNHYGAIIPFGYTLVLLYVIFKAIRDQYQTDQNRKTFKASLAVYLALSPWAVLTAFGAAELFPLAKILCTNTGVVIISILIVKQSVLRARREFKLLAGLTLHGNDSVFAVNCERLQLSKREMDIAPYLIEGLSYKEIAEKLFISERMVDTHVRNIYRKCGVNNKIGLLNVLYKQHGEGLK